MYNTLPNFVLGFHGCDVSVYEKVIHKGETLKKSENDYDWLGHGIYFWENNPQRALEFGEEQKARGRIKEVRVIGAIIDLGYCLNLMESVSLGVVRNGYDALITAFQTLGIELPQNKNIKNNHDFLLRNLDCAVIQAIHGSRQELKLREYDSVRGLFTEGDPLYPEAGFRAKNHIQICVRNPNCIKGYFAPLEPNTKYPIP